MVSCNPYDKWGSPEGGSTRLGGLGDLRLDFPLVLALRAVATDDTVEPPLRRARVPRQPVVEHPMPSLGFAPEDQSVTAAAEDVSTQARPPPVRDPQPGRLSCGGTGPTQIVVPAKAFHPAPEVATSAHPGPPPCRPRLNA
ncbi:hypothetical protein FIBSPDRAFT_886328 [Athelia psychrophila]|uniref:Uncharacterized protein n=1 Tax=Athelia psychrophila TaxID=1759441 RepID=A0A166R0X8_9AGAM|nr:hypothetical protein FIBSPDRAFT_886328 [Fibularhizoctonia sp. CBS 109695]